MPDDARASPLPPRPALYAVLGAITDHPAAQWVDAPDRGGVVVAEGGARLGVWLSGAAWTVADVGEAVERLINADLLPPPWVDDASRRFTCAACGGAAPRDCPGCLGRPLPRPATLAGLVAWASLGAAQITQAEELAREAARRLAPWGVAGCERRAVWAVGPPPVRDAREEEWRRTGLPQGWPRAASYPRDDPRVDAWPAGAPCPHAPLLALRGAGLALDRITDEGLVLVVPPLQAPSSDERPREGPGTFLPP